MKMIQADIPIFLCGFMGTGKTSVGKHLATLLGCPFFDSDHLIEAKENQTISSIFSEKGEPYFRALEKEITCEVAGYKSGVISLGGGALHDTSVVDMLKSAGILIYLDTPIEKILKRIEASNRPMLKDMKENPGHFLIALLEKRVPLYKMAHFSIKTSEFRNPLEVAKAILTYLNHV